MVLGEDVDVKRDMARAVCESVDRGEGGGEEECGEWKDDGSWDFLSEKERETARARVRGKWENVIRPSDDERRTGQEVLPFDSRGANGDDTSHSDMQDLPSYP